jgi:hypothetical protein
VNSTWGKIKDVVLRLIAKAASGPGFLANAIRTATLSVAHALAQLLKMGVAEDLRRLKEDGLRRSKAKTDAEEAKVRELMAKAAEAENKANLLNRNDRISRAEELQKLAEAAKTNAEAQVQLSKAEAERARARADAIVKLIHALTKLKEKGGWLGVDPNNIAGLLGMDDLDDLGDDPPLLPPPPNSGGGPKSPMGSGGKAGGTKRPKKPKK